MSERFADKYRIKSARMRNWDYRRNGKYFVTICTGGRECYFGDIENKKVKLTEIGILADKFWLAIPDHFNGVKLDEFIIMPNHIHGIIKIEKPDDIKNGYGIGPLQVETLHAETLQVETLHAETLQVETLQVETLQAETLQAETLQAETLQAETLHATSLPGYCNDIDKNKNGKMAKISPKRGSLSTIVRSYKSVVTKNARTIHPDFYWQSRFYDNIIRDDVSLANIRTYIKDNPKNWASDELNPGNEKQNK